MKTPYQTTFDEQVAGLDPETQATHRRMLVRQRARCSVSRWWFEQMRTAVDKAPEPKTKDETKMKPQPITDLELVFPAQVFRLLPPYADIPDDFKCNRTPWNKIVDRWFFEGLPRGTEFVPKPSINKQAAMRHLKTVMGSFEPKHEHKTAGCAYLMSLWFEEIKIPEQMRKAVETAPDTKSKETP